MRATHTNTLVTIIAADQTINSLLGGPHVYRALVARPPTVPSITIRLEDDTATPMVQQRTTGLRVHTARHQYNIWTRESQEHAETIEEELDKILFTGPIPDTWDWIKQGRSIAYDDDLDAWHTSTRYSYKYMVREV